MDVLLLYDLFICNGEKAEENVELRKVRGEG
jgi:hypothetical protein